MNVLEKVSDFLSSRGNISFLVLIDYKPCTVQDRRVFVKMVTKNGHAFPVFGSFSGKGKDQEFVEFPGLEGVIENSLQSRTVGSYVIPVAPDENEDTFICEINECLRVINFVRPIFHQLADVVYKQGTTTKISSPTIEFEIEDVNKLHSYFENYFANTYVNMFNIKIGKLFSRNLFNNYLRLLLSLNEFIPFIFTGPCIINPLVDSGRFGKVFKQTKLYKEASKHSYELKDSKVYVLTNREICTCLGLDKYIPFASMVVMYLSLGLVNPRKYPSMERYAYLHEGNVYNTPAEVANAGLSMDNVKMISTLNLLCQRYRARLGLRSESEFNKYMDIISTATLL